MDDFVLFVREVFDKYKKGVPTLYQVDAWRRHTLSKGSKIATLRKALAAWDGVDEPAPWELHRDAVRLERLKQPRYKPPDRIFEERWDRAYRKWRDMHGYSRLPDRGEILELM